MSPAAATLLTEEPSRAKVLELQQRISAMQATKLDTRRLPTHPALSALLDGGLKQGAAYSVDRSATLLMAMLSGPSAARFVVRDRRCARVRHRGGRAIRHRPRAPRARAASRRPVAHRHGRHRRRHGSRRHEAAKRAPDGAIARLAARLRQRGTTMFVLGTWPGSEAMLSLSHSEWHGIGAGHGHLTSREVTVTVSTKTTAQPRSARLWLPDELEQFRESELLAQPLGERTLPARLEATA